MRLFSIIEIYNIENVPESVNLQILQEKFDYGSVQNMKKLINNGVALTFSNAFTSKGLLKEQLKKYLVDYNLKATRMEVYKNLGTVKIYYKDDYAKKNLQNKLLQSVTHKFIEKNQQGKFEDIQSSKAIELTINLTGSLIKVADDYFKYSNEFIRQYDNLTQKIYEEFFQIKPTKSIAESVKFYNEIKSIVAIGNANYQYEIESILTNYTDPVPPPMFGGATK